MGKVLAFAAIAEIGTGLALAIDPVLVAGLLLGKELAGVGIPVGRCFGIALLVVGLACWPGRQPVAGNSPAARAMLAYNALIASYLAYLGTAGQMGGVLLWPAVALHAAVALLLVWKWRER
jgi:hypothetical protein